MKQQRSYPRCTSPARRADIKGGATPGSVRRGRSAAGRSRERWLGGCAGGQLLSGYRFYNDASKSPCGSSPATPMTALTRPSGAGGWVRPAVSPPSCQGGLPVLPAHPREADQMPGLTVDRYDTILSVQVLSLGMERVKGCGVQALVEVLREMGQEIRGIFERNDVSIQEQEGLTEGKGWYPLPGLPTRNLPWWRLWGKRNPLPGGCGRNGQKAGFSWTRNTTGRRWGASPGANSAGLLYPHRFLRPQLPPWEVRSTSPVWTSPSPPSIWLRRTPGATG